MLHFSQWQHKNDYKSLLPISSHGEIETRQFPDSTLDVKGGDSI